MSDNQYTCYGVFMKDKILMPDELYYFIDAHNDMENL